MDDLERFNHTWDKAYDSGYHSGYMDAIGELWKLEHIAAIAGDLAAAHIIADLVVEIRSREAAVVEHNKQLRTEAEARTKQS